MTNWIEVSRQKRACHGAWNDTQVMSITQHMAALVLQCINAYVMTFLDRRQGPAADGSRSHRITCLPSTASLLP